MLVKLTCHEHKESFVRYGIFHTVRHGGGSHGLIVIPFVILGVAKNRCLK